MRWRTASRLAVALMLSGCLLAAARPHRRSASLRGAAVEAEESLEEEELVLEQAHRLEEEDEEDHLDYSEELSDSWESATSRRLEEEEHDGVPTNTTPASQEIADDWEHDYQVLKPVLQARGYNVSGARSLCGLPRVYCDTGYRRRAPAYADAVMGDWVGREYQLIVPLKDSTQPVAMDPALFTLRRVGFFQVYVNSGPMPDGLERLNHIKLVWIEGNRTHGIEGGLPEGFWNAKTRMFLMAQMGPQFTGHLPPDLPMCEHLDYRLYLYRLQAFTGDISALRGCSKITSVIEVFLNPLLGGNVWAAMLGWDSLTTINLWGSDFSGVVPFTDGSSVAPGDPWADWCRGRNGSKVHFRITQRVNGPLPAGLQACSELWTRFMVADNGHTGPFPLNFSDSTHMNSDGIRIWGNSFTGPLPDVPPQVTILDMHGNRWEGDIPASWSNVEEVDLSDCEMTGLLPDIAASIEVLTLTDNHFQGPVPDSWFRNSKLTRLDLSGNNISGPPFTWGWTAKDPLDNYNILEFLDVYKPSPAWPLEELSLNGNPLGISVGFLMAMMSQYELKVLSASDCQLRGYVNSEDLYAQSPKAGGGVEPRPGAVAYNNLEKLDLSLNPGIQTFGYNDLQATPDSCWRLESWLVRLPRLSDLNLQGCTSLTDVNPQAYLHELDLRGTSVARGPPLLPSIAECLTMGSRPVTNCPGESWEACLYLVEVYSAADWADGLECGEVGATRTDDSGRPSVKVNPEFFGTDTLCRCKAGYEERDGSCAQVVKKSGGQLVVEEVDTSKLALGIGIACGATAAFVALLVLLVLHRRRRQQSNGQDTGFAAALEAQGNASLTATEDIFKDMDLVEIMTIGLKEHWLIPKEHIEFKEMERQRSGGFGEVRRGVLLGSTDIAIKVPKWKENQFSKAHAQSLVNEMRLFRRIRHPNIVLFHGVTALEMDSNIAMCLVLEWIVDGDFGKYVKSRRRDGSFEEECQAQLHDPVKILHEQKVLIDVARGMQYLHGQDPPILHRDLKPGNVLIEKPEPPRAKIADFGLSTILEFDEGANMKAGTRVYMAPEVAAETNYHTPADVFSFGCLCLYAFSGKHPEEAATAQVACRELCSVQSLPKTVPEVAVECLHAEPSARLDFSEIYQRLAQQQHSMDAGSAELGSSTNLGTGTGGRTVPSKVNSSAGSGTGAAMTSSSDGKPLMSL